jgi:PAS domain S-box-containing protein
MSIRAQILILAFIVAIPAAGIIVYSGIQMREASTHDARMETQRLADNIAAEQQNLIAAAQQLIIALAQLPEVKKQNRDRVQPVLRDILKLNAQYSNIFIADLNGLVWATAVPTKPPFIVSDRRYFNNALASGQLSSGEYVISRATARPAFNVAYPLRDERGTIIGVISVGFVLDAFTQVLERAKLPAGSSFVLLDHKGIVLYRAIEPEKYIGRQYDPDLFKQMQEGPDVHTYSSIIAIGGDKRIVTYHKLRLPEEQSPYMYVRAGIPIAAVLADANKVLIRNLALFTSFLSLAVLFAWLIGKRSIADRITLLENATRDLANGDLHVRLSDLVVGGELGRLGQTFDAMARKLSLRERALIESEQNYREIFNTTKDAIFVHDAESGSIIEINKTVEELYGYSREEILHQKTVQDLSSGESPYSLREAGEWIRKTFEEGPQHFEWLARKKNGELFWTEVVLSTTRIGGAGRVLAVARDITERRQAEEALRERDELLRQAVRVSQIGIFEHDQRTDTIYWSPQQRVIYGWGPDEPVTLQVFIDHVHPEDLESVVASVRRAHDPAGDGIWDVEHRIIRRDGTVRWLKERSQTFFEGESDARHPVRTIGAVLDITERKKTEEEQQKLVSVIEMSRDFIGIADLDGRMLYVNAAGLKLVGLDSGEDSRRRDLSDFLMEADHRRLEKEMLPTIFGTGTWIGELALRHFKTGSPIPVETSGFIIKDRKNDKPIALANISRDISERRHAEEEKQKLQAQLVQVQKMESIGQLAGGIAHDFNNILAAIIGYGSIMQKKMGTDDPNRMYLDHILTAAERAASLTQSLLAFGRKQVICPRDIDLNESIRKVEKFLTRIIGEDIILTTALSTEALMIYADVTQIEQVLMNLATNARDAMPTGGRLMIEAGRVMLDDEYVRAKGYGTPGPYAVLNVSDTGEGMDEETQKTIFEPFFTTKEIGRGTGLGLAIVYGIVKQNDGYINVYSEPGKGTTFKIYLPLVSSRAGEDWHPEVLQPLRGGPETILFAEDNETVRLLNRDVLQEFGYTVIEAADGEEALQKFREHGDRINLFILDVIMPKKNGREVFEEARRSNPNVKAIFTSGYPADLIQKEGVLEKGLHFLSKPSSPEALVRKVREVLDQERVAP